MPQEMTLVRAQDGSMRPASSTDQEVLASLPIGQGVRFTAVRIKPRSLQHHRLYWGGLIELAFTYWEPTGGVLSPSEISTLAKFADWLDAKGSSTGAIRRAAKEYLRALADRRSQSIQAPEKSKQALHEWIKVEAGYFDYVVTPVGVKKQARSISFNAMDQDEFNDFYRAAFSVVWRFILSRTFEDEQQAETAINQLLAMG